MVETALYARVSTQDQDLQHQQENLWSYATDELDIEPQNLTVLKDKATGTNTDRSGYREMLELVRDGEVQQVVVREVTRLGRTMREISENVHEIVQDHNAGIQVMNDDLNVDHGDELSMQDKMLLNVLAWSAELEAKKIKENTKAGLRAAEKQGKWTKRPPYGFTTDDDGYLQPSDDFGKARRAILYVEEEGLSHRKASKRTGVSRRTIPRLLERKTMYFDEYTMPEDSE
jgi:DNA invertase Pin-like site-specific DNA recombinase